jgi:hypothetical protein
MKDNDKAILILQKTLSCLGDNYSLYIVFVNMLRQLNPSLHNSFVKMIEVCDRALAANSKLSQEQKEAVAKIYVDYLHENCSEISFVR